MERSLKSSMGSRTKEGNRCYGEEEDHCSYAFQLATSAALPMVLNAVVRLNVFEIIAKAGPAAQLSPTQIASEMPTQNPEAAAMLDRMLRLLTSHSVLTCSVVHSSCGAGERVYGLAPVAKYFLKGQDGESLGPFMGLNQSKVMIDTLYELEDAVLQGGVAFIRAHGMPIFKYAEKDTKFNETFNMTMVQTTRVAMRKVFESYKGFGHLKTLVDVGGGHGAALDTITAKYPALKGINFDLPHVIEHAPIIPGVEHVGGDMFESVPTGDAILLKKVLHDWDDEHCLKLLKNCYKALPENGKIIVMEAIFPNYPDTSTSTKSTAQIDMLMLAAHRAKERSEQEFLALATAAGFRGIRKECLAGDAWVMEFEK